MLKANVRTSLIPLESWVGNGYPKKEGASSM